MIGRDFERLMAQVMRRTDSEVATIAKELRKADLLPRGGRGHNAPELTAEHKANFLIAAAIASRASHATEDTRKYISLRVSKPPYDETLGEAITNAILSGPDATPLPVLRRLCKSEPMAIFEFNIEGHKLYREYMDFEGTPELINELMGATSYSTALSWVEIGPGVINLVSSSKEWISLYLTSTQIMKRIGLLWKSKPEAVRSVGAADRAFIMSLIAITNLQINKAEEEQALCERLSAAIEAYEKVAGDLPEALDDQEGGDG